MARRVFAAIQNIWSGSIRRQLILGIALIHAVLMTVFVVDLVARQSAFLNQQSVDQAQNMAETFAANSTSWVLANDVIGLEEVVYAQARHENLSYAMVHDLKGRVLSHTDRNYVGQYVSDEISIGLLSKSPVTSILVNDDHLIDVGAPVMVNDSQIGWVRVGINRGSITDNLAIIVRDGIAYTFVAIIAGTILAYFMGVGLSRGIYRLMDVADTVSHGAHDARADVDRSDELGVLARDFNRMLDALDKARSDIISSEKRAQDFANISSDLFWETDAEHRYTFLSERFEEVTGVQNKSVIGARRWDFAIPLEAGEAWAKHKADLVARRPFRNFEYSPLLPNGERMSFSASGVPVYDESGVFAGYRGTTSNVTERVKQEQIIRHEQKMDAIGQLTGGIAHDFNNMLGVILGYSELLKQSLGREDSDTLKYNDEVLAAGTRAKKLTAQLLEFSRIAPASEDEVDINLLLSGLEHMLQTTLTPRIKLTYELEKDLWPVWVDRARLEDSILNIVINAMHAIVDSGSLRVSTHNMQLVGSDVENMNIAAGDYVALVFEDTGCGMTAEVKQKVFDPFFTTKGSKGTGLGLSQVYGFVQQAKGDVLVQSEQSHGTTITLYLPRHDTAKEPSIRTIRQAASSRPPVTTSDQEREVVLLVDDERSLRDLTKVFLTRHGYEVLCAESGEEALSILKNEKVDLMISDVIMPYMDGYQLASEVKKQYPTVLIQMVSGYIDERRTGLGHNSLHKQRLLKPVQMDDLLERVRALLDERA